MLVWTSRLHVAAPRGSKKVTPYPLLGTPRPRDSTGTAGTCESHRQAEARPSPRNITCLLWISSSTTGKPRGLKHVIAPIAKQLHRERYCESSVCCRRWPLSVAAWVRSRCLCLSAIDPNEPRAGLPHCPTEQYGSLGTYYHADTRKLLIFIWMMLLLHSTTRCSCMHTTLAALFHCLRGQHARAHEVHASIGLGRHGRASASPVLR